MLMSERKNSLGVSFPCDSNAASGYLAHVVFTFHNILLQAANFFSNDVHNEILTASTFDLTMRDLILPLG